MLEWLRHNRLVVVTPNGDAQTPDHVNEYVNLWNKSCVKTANFQERIRRSKNIMLMKKCGYAAFGKSKNVASSSTSQEESVEKLVRLFEKVNLFPVDPSVQRKWDDNFFWNSIEKPAAKGSQRDASKEEVAKTAAEQQLFDRLCKTDEE